MQKKGLGHKRPVGALPGIVNGPVEENAACVATGTCVSCVSLQSGRQAVQRCVNSRGSTQSTFFGASMVSPDGPLVTSPRQLHSDVSMTHSYTMTLLPFLTNIVSLFFAPGISSALSGLIWSSDTPEAPPAIQLPSSSRTVQHCCCRNVGESCLKVTPTYTPRQHDQEIHTPEANMK